MIAIKPWQWSPLLVAAQLAAQAPAKPLSVEARREDLAKFTTDFFDRDHSYSAEHRAAAQARLDRLRQDERPMSPLTFELELARIVALGDNGHTRSLPGPRSRRYNRVGFRLTPFGEDFYVLRADSANGDLLGARLVGIGRKSAKDAVTAARALFGGTDPWRDRSVGFVLESPEQLHALGIVTQAGSAAYRFETDERKRIERVILAAPADSTRDMLGSSRWLFPDPVAGQGPGWRTLLPVDQAPWSLREQDVPFRWRVAPEVDGIIVELRQTTNSPERPIRAFLSAMADTIRARQPRNIVIDMRANGGGDLNTARDFMQSLPTLVPGRIFALTSPWTFSAAISSVGYLKQAGKERVTIVGELVGDRMEFWAEGRIVELPRSGASYTFAGQRHDYLNGCKAFTDCHGSVVRFPIAVPTFAPDIEAPWTIEAYRAGRDPAMEAVARTLGRQGVN